MIWTPAGAGALGTGSKIRFGLALTGKNMPAVAPSRTRIVSSDNKLRIYPPIAIGCCCLMKFYIFWLSGIRLTPLVINEYDKSNGYYYDHRSNRYHGFLIE